MIAETKTLDEVEVERYRALTAATIARHGGRYLVRGADPDLPEGDWPDRAPVVIVEFPTMARLRAWYASEDYAEALVVAESAVSRRLLFVPGLDETT